MNYKKIFIGNIYIKGYNKIYTIYYCITWNLLIIDYTYNWILINWWYEWTKTWMKRVSLYLIIIWGYNKKSVE